MIALVVALAGGVGAVARHVVDSIAGRRGPAWAVTLGINLTGSLLMGLLAEAPPVAAAVAGVGFCGGFTTFSTACLQTVRLFRGWWPGGYMAITAIGCLLSAAVGSSLSGLIWQ